MKISNVAFLTAAVGIAASVAMVAPALAQTNVVSAKVQAGHGAWVGAGGNGGMQGKMQPGIFGTVSSVSGNTVDGHFRTAANEANAAAGSDGNASAEFDSGGIYRGCHECKDL